MERVGASGVTEVNGEVKYKGATKAKVGADVAAQGREADELPVLWFYCYCVKKTIIDLS